MKIVFFGTSRFAVDVLRCLAEKGRSPAAVITQPDRKSGRSLKVSPPPVKLEAEKLGISIFQPADINDEQFIKEAEAFGADAFVVVSFGSMLGKCLLSMPKIGALNIHPSLLPKYRGAAPIQRALLAGDKKTGVTIIKMNERLDAGDIILQKELDIEGADTGETLSSKLASMGADLLLEALRLSEEGKAVLRRQNENEATPAPKLKKEEGLINWDSPVLNILNKMKALKPWPGTYSFLGGKAIKIVEAKAAPAINTGKSLPGEVILADEKKGFIVAAKGGAIAVLRVQIEGKKEMPAELFLRGHSVKAGTRLGR